MKKLRSLALLLAVCMLTALLPAAAMADEPITLEVMRFEHASAPFVKDSYGLKLLEEKTGVKLEISMVPQAEYGTKTSVLLGSNSMPEVMYLTPADINKYARDGMFESLTPYLEAVKLENYKKYVENDPNIGMTMVDGQLYGFVQCVEIMDGTDSFTRTGYLPVIRTDLLEKHDLPVPTTYEELATVLKKLKDLYPDSKPWSSRGGLYWSTIYNWGSGDGMYFEQNEGKYVYGPTYKTSYDWLAYMNDLFAYGVLDQDIFNCSHAQWIENMSNGSSFFYIDNPGFFASCLPSLRQIEPDADLRTIKQFTNIYGEQRANWYTANWYERQFVISADISQEKKDAAIAMFDWMYSDEGIMTMNYGVAGVDYTVDENGLIHMSSEMEEIWNSGKRYAVGLDLEVMTMCISSRETYVDLDDMTEEERADYLFWDERYDEMYANSRPEYGFREDVMDPPFTEDEQERLDEIKSALSVIWSPAMINLIIGETPLDQYETIRQQMIDAGAAEMEEIYNEAYARVLGE